MQAVERAAERAKIDMDVVGFDLPRWKGSIKKGPRGAVPYFAMWQKGLGPLAKKLHAKTPFDVMHHLTFASSWIGSGLSPTGLAFRMGTRGPAPPRP